MNRKFSHLISCALLSLAAHSAPSSATGIPVYDVAAFGNAVQQLQSWSDQFRQMQAQIDAQKEQLRSMTGKRGLANILNIKPGSAVHPDYRVLLAATRSHENATKLASSQIDALIQSTNVRYSLIQALMSVAANTTDQKEVAEIQARISAEQAAIQNESKEVELVSQSVKLQREMIDQANRSRRIQALQFKE
jgi:type IV secretion system protein VirB5